MDVPRRGAQRRLSLTFLDRELEERYQVAGGLEGLAGFRMIALASGIAWSATAVVLPMATSLTPVTSTTVTGSMAGLSLLVLLISGWASTMDKQHALVALLTSANALAILWLALRGGVLPGYGVAAMMLLFVWGTVARTRFIYAGIRTCVMSAGFVVTVLLFPDPKVLVLDALLFVTAAAGSLLGLRILERSRRQLFFQDVVITEQSEQLAGEIAKSERLILNMLPRPIALRLRDGEQTIADDYTSVTVLFADIVGFTPLAERLTARQAITLLSELFTAFDDLVTAHGVEKIKTIGDAYLAVGGIDDSGPNHAEQIVSLGLDMLDEAARHVVLGSPLQLRIGVHTGPAVGGVIGSRKFAFDLWGDTINVASRLQTGASPGLVHVSESTWGLLRDHWDGVAEGEQELRGHAPVCTYALRRPRDPMTPRAAVTG